MDKGIHQTHTTLQLGMLRKHRSIGDLNLVGALVPQMTKEDHHGDDEQLQQPMSAGDVRATGS